VDISTLGHITERNRKYICNRASGISKASADSAACGPTNIGSIKSVVDSRGLVSVLLMQRLSGLEIQE
jgi:hypothetical protein